MPNIQTVSNLSNAVTTRYTQKYIRAAKGLRLYDQLAGNVASDSLYNLESRKGLGSTYTFNFASDMTIGSSAISETTDVTPQMLRDATSTVTPTSRSEGLKWSELLDLSVYTDYVAARAEILGRNMMETVDAQAYRAALAGNLVQRAVARASLDAGTATHTFTEAALWQVGALLASLKAPNYVDEYGNGNWLAIVHSDAYYDLLHGGNVVNIALYQDKQILFNGEIGKIGDFRILASPYAKVFMGAGVANGSSADTTLNDAAANALDTTFTVASATNVSVGRHLTIGTVETANTHYDSNETVRWVSGTTTITCVGAGANGGLRFDHANGETVNNSDNVYPVAYGSPKSLVKVFASDVGEYGKLVGPRVDGNADQWQQMFWKWYGAYGRVAENRIARGEYSSSLDA